MAEYPYNARGRAASWLLWLVDWVDHYILRHRFFGLCTWITERQCWMVRAVRVVRIERDPDDELLEAALRGEDWSY